MSASQRHDAAIELGYVHAGYRRRRKATARLDALTFRYLRNERAKLDTLRLMSHDASNEGRGAGDGHGTVNGTEVRWSERWLIPSDPTVDYDTVTSIMPDGTRTQFVRPDADADTTRQAAPRNELTHAELVKLAKLAAVGSIQHDYTQG